ncbi:hypothetical protein BGY98DRAFT_967885, partial [Russula aff. rugulosa BPL654]
MRKQGFSIAYTRARAIATVTPLSLEVRLCRSRIFQVGRHQGGRQLIKVDVARSRQPPSRLRSLVQPKTLADFARPRRLQRETVKQKTHVDDSAWPPSRRSLWDVVKYYDDGFASPRSVPSESGDVPNSSSLPPASLRKSRPSGDLGPLDSDEL